LGVVVNTVTNIKDFESFALLCRKLTVFDPDELRKFWVYNASNRPFVVRFLYVHSSPKRPNLAQLKEHRIISEAPRGFELLREDAFQTLLELSHAEQHLIID
jgi:hypothetical protein